MRYLALDTETSLIPPQGTDKVNIRHHVPDLICTTWAWAGTEAGELAMWDDVRAHERLFSQDDDVFYVFHNAAFDLAVLTKAFPQLRERIEGLVHEGRILDTRVMYLMRNPDPQHKAITLAFLAMEFLSRELKGKGGVQLSFRRDTPLTQEQRDYAIDDAIVTAEVARVLRALPLGSIRDHYRAPPPNKIIATHPETNMAHPDVEYSRAAALLAWYLVPVGMEINPIRLSELHEKFEAENATLQEALVSHGLVRVVRMPKARPYAVLADDEDYDRTWAPTGANPPKLRRRWKGEIQEVDGKIVKTEAAIRARFEAFAGENAIDAPMTDSGQISLRRDDWKDYEGTMPPELETFMAFQKCSKYLTAFLRPLVHSNGRQVNPAYYIPGAATGRWACRKVNLTQVPRSGGLRSIYRAREGCSLVYADYPTLELYTLAHVMHCMGIEGPLMESLRSGEDIHTRTAALMFDKPQAEVTKEERQGAKEANFGLPGGMGVRRFWLSARSKGLDWDRAKAYEIRNRWFAAYPDIRQYLNAFEVNPYNELRPGHVEPRVWLQHLGFDPDDTWPRPFDLTRRINNGAVYTCVLPTGRTIPDRQYSAAANIFFQGTGADVITVAFNLACKRGLNPVAVVHDSMTAEPKTAWAPGDGRILAQCMQEALHIVCPSVPIPEIDYEICEEWK